MSKIWPHNIVDSSQFDSHKNDFTLQIPYGGTTTNVGNAYEIATPVIPALTEGMAVCVKINTDSTGAATLNWAGTGDKNIVTPDGGAVINLKNDGIYTFRYDGVSYILQNIALDLSAHLADTATAHGATASRTASKILLRDASGNAPANGLSFPATQVPSSDANTLDDYEEGTWTGAFLCGTSGTITISNSYKTGAYTKIGRQVTVTGLFLVDSVSSPVGALSLMGLPFTSATGSQFHASVSVYPAGLTTAATTSIVGRIQANSNVIDLSSFAAGALADLASNVQANTSFWISATYFV